MIKEYPKNCWYKVDQFIFQIDYCQQYQIGTKLIIFSKQKTSSAKEKNDGIFVDVTEVLIDYSQNYWFYETIQKTQIYFLNLRLEIYSRIRELLPEPEASLVFSLLFGGRSFLSTEVKEKVSQAGVDYLIAASGMHVSLLILLFNRLLIFSSRRTKLFLTVALIFIYVHLAALSTSVVRAGLMTTLVSLSSLFNKKIPTLYNLFLVAALMLIWQPLLILEVSFQLSFVAVLGILLTQKIFPWGGGLFTRLETADLLTLVSTQKQNLWQKILLATRDNFLVSLTVNLWIWPILVYHFAQLNLANLISGLVLSWLLLPIFIFTWILLLLILFLPTNALSFSFWLIFSTPTYYLAHCFWQLINLLSRLQWLNFSMEFKNNFFILFWYVFLLALLFVFKKIKRKTKTKQQNWRFEYEKNLLAANY